MSDEGEVCALLALLFSSVSKDDFHKSLESYKELPFFKSTQFYSILWTLTNTGESEDSILHFRKSGLPKGSCMNETKLTTILENHLPLECKKIANKTAHKISALTKKIPLAQIYAAHSGKISDKWASYLPLYDELMQPYRCREIKMLEIGVQNGGSLEIWNKYFDFPSLLLGCDINQECGNLEYDSENIHIVVGDASASETRKKIKALASSFDIIIDDGSHVSSDCIKNLRQYFDMLSPGGTYIIEDLHCSYWSEFGGGLFDSRSIINRLKEFVDYPNFEFWGHSADNLLEKQKKIGDKNNKYRSIESVKFYNSVVVIKKSYTQTSLVGKRVVVGKRGLVTGDDYVKNNEMEINRR